MEIRKNDEFELTIEDMSEDGAGIGKQDGYIWFVKDAVIGDRIEAKFLTEGNWNVGSALSLIMMVLILISLSILRKADPNGEGGGIA
mgnify:CR=1 FL=1